MDFNEATRAREQAASDKSMADALAHHDAVEVAYKRGSADERERIRMDVLSLYVPCPPDDPEAQQHEGGTVKSIWGCDTLQQILDILAPTGTDED
jgi:hypothetical protein